MNAYLLVIFCLASAGLINADQVDHSKHDHDHQHQRHSSMVDTWNICWRDGYCRGEGHPPSQCNETLELSRGQCYTPCEDGYVGDGADCWSPCPEGFQDHHDKCVIPSQTYLPCPLYDPCGIVTKGCKDNCTDGYHWNYCSCYKPGQVLTKKHYTRGPGQHATCFSNETISHGECYAPCEQGYLDEGSICWGNYSSGSTTFTVNCNHYAFGASDNDCQALNSFLINSGVTPNCLAPLDLAINLGDPTFGPPTCSLQINNVYPTLTTSSSVC